VPRQHLSNRFYPRTSRSTQSPLFQMCGDLTLSTPFRASVQPRASTLNHEDRARPAATPRGARTCGLYCSPLPAAASLSDAPQGRITSGLSRRLGREQQKDKPSSLRPSKGTQALGGTTILTDLRATFRARERQNAHSDWLWRACPARPLRSRRIWRLCRQLPALVESERPTFGRSCKLSTCSQERVFRSFP